MNNNLYKFNNYKDLIASLYCDEKGKKRGYISKLARVTKCQPAYISKVFSGGADISLEQASLIAEDLCLNEEQIEFFFTLISMERAGTLTLRRFYKKKIDAIKADKNNVTKVLTDKQGEDEIYPHYYSHWAYAAIHMIVGIEEYRSLDDISEKLMLSKRFSKVILDDLTEWKLIIKKNNLYFPGKRNLHLKSSSPFLKTHHQNWRFKAIQAINERNDQNLNYSSVTCINRETREKIKSLLLDSISTTHDHIHASKDDEVLMGINIDFYEL